jgi:glycosyltransferase involved in cell wall biosynthesis
MTQMPPILYFGNDWFADNRTSSHHVARQLARRTKVLYFEVPGLRPPQATSRDIRRIGRKLTRALGRRFDAADQLAVRTVPQLPVHGSAFVRGLNAFASSTYAEMAARREGMTDPIVWCTVPHVASFVPRLRRSLLVYHCIDDYSALPGVDARAVRMMDDSLTRDADLVVAASGPVFAAKQRLNERTLLMPHGVDVAHFGRAQSEELRRPEDLPVQRPIVGFVGLIEQWIDLELVAYLAENIPEATFVMIGRIAVPAADVPSRPNLLFLGPRPYESLPAYGRFFDAAIIPYKLTDQVLAANPLKLREYLAMGLPSVSVSTPEIDQFADVVSVNRTREDFLRSLRSALATRSTDDAIRRRMRAVEDVSWESRVAGLLTHIDTLIHQRDNGSRNLEAIAR